MDDTNTLYNNITGPALVNRIDSILQHKYLTRQQLADSCGFSVQNIARWKTQGAMPDLKIGVKIADFLNVPLYWLITGHNERGEIPADDFQLLDTFHSFNEDDKEVIMATLKALSKKYIKKGFEGHQSVD